jgi:hypothetical protein
VNDSVPTGVIVHPLTTSLPFDYQLCASSSIRLASMRKYVLAHRNGIDGLELQADEPIPQLRSSTDVRQCRLYCSKHILTKQILIRIKALSLNARDLQIVNNDYPAPHPIPDRVVPVSGKQNNIRCEREMGRL